MTEPDRTDHADNTEFVAASQARRAALRLRAPAPRVTRLSRKVLAGAAALAGLGLGGALIFGLQTRSDPVAPEPVYNIEHRRTADAVQALPRDYADIPQLGPRLPGDLGRPMLAQGHIPLSEPGPDPFPDPVQQARLEDRQAAHTSALFVDTRTQAVPASQPEEAVAQPDHGADPGASHRLQAGTVIAAALITGIRSDRPGPVIAQITQPVYDSATGRIVLIPQGARLVGAYEEDVGFGQRRLSVVWTRLVFPGGHGVELDRLPSSGAQGFAGLAGAVDGRGWALARAAGLSTLLSVGAELTLDSEDRLVEALRDGMQDTLNDAGQQIVRRQLDAAPTLTVRPGTPLRIVLANDLLLPTD